MVYCIGNKAAGVCKIGFTNDVAARIIMLQTGSYCTLSVFATVDGGLDLEAELHEIFDEHRLHGEWFRLVPEIVNQFQIDLNAFPDDLVSTKERKSRVEQTSFDYSLINPLFFLQLTSVQSIQLFIALAELTLRNQNSVTLNSQARLHLMAKLSISSSKLSALLKNLMVHNFLRKEGKHMLINPFAIFHGNELSKKKAERKWSAREGEAQVVDPLPTPIE